MKAFPLSTMVGLNQQGMDLRDYFAAQAAQRLIDLVTHPKDVARNAYIIADAMMEARERNETTQT
jgi:hypothetical protein